MKYYIFFLLFMFSSFCFSQLNNNQIDCILDNYDNSTICYGMDTIRLTEKIDWQVPVREVYFTNKDSLYSMLSRRIQWAVDSYERQYKTKNFTSIIFGTSTRYRNRSVFEGVPYSYIAVYQPSRNYYSMSFAFQGYGIKPE